MSSYDCCMLALFLKHLAAAKTSLIFCAIRAAQPSATATNAISLSPSPSSLVTSTVFGNVDDDDDEMAFMVGKMAERLGDNLLSSHWQ